jgi:hypothetical protein
MASDMRPMDRAATGVVPGMEIFGIVPLLGAVVLILNDQFLKAAQPSWLTGKLSDVAGMMFFPFLLSATWSWGKYAVLRLGQKPVFPPDVALTLPVLTVCVALSGFCLAFINVSAFGNDCYVQLLCAINFFNRSGDIQSTMDASDCLALAILPAVWWWGKQWIDTDR